MGSARDLGRDQVLARVSHRVSWRQCLLCYDLLLNSRWALGELSGVEVFRIGYEGVRKAKPEVAGASDRVGITDACYTRYEPPQSLYEHLWA